MPAYISQTLIENAKHRLHFDETGEFIEIFCLQYGMKARGDLEAAVWYRKSGDLEKERYYTALLAESMVE